MTDIFHKNSDTLKIFFSFVLSVFMVVILAVILLTATKKINFFVVVTGSMHPIIKVDSLILVRDKDFNKLQEGDIISFYADINLSGKKQVVTHYFLEHEDGGRAVRTRRHNSYEPDSWRIYKSDYIGKYVFSINKGGLIVRYFSHFLGMINLALSIIIVYTAYSLISYGEKNLYGEKLLR